MKRIKRRESYFMICRVCQLNESRLHKFTYSTYFYCMIISYLFSHDSKDSPSFDIINIIDIIQKNHDLLEVTHIQTSV